MSRNFKLHVSSKLVNFNFIKGEGVVHQRHLVCSLQPRRIGGAKQTLQTKYVKIAPVPRENVFLYKETSVTVNICTENFAEDKFCRRQILTFREFERFSNILQN